MLSTKQAADKLGIAYDTMRIWIAKGWATPSGSIGRNYLWSAEDIERIRKERNKRKSREPQGSTDSASEGK